MLRYLLEIDQAAGKVEIKIKRLLVIFLDIRVTFGASLGTYWFRSRE